MTALARMLMTRGTAAALTSDNPILVAGELGVETDTGRLKIGDGVTAWTSLGYVLGIAAPLTVPNGGTGATTLTGYVKGNGASAMTASPTIPAEDISGAGTYTPTLTGVENVAASTAYAAQYLRVGSIVTVSGRIDIDPTAAAATRVGVTLPVASALTSGIQCCGVGVFNSTTAVAIYGDGTNDRAEFQWVSATTANSALYYHFTYRVI